MAKIGIDKHFHCERCGDVLLTDSLSALCSKCQSEIVTIRRNVSKEIYDARHHEQYIRDAQRR